MATPRGGSQLLSGADANWRGSGARVTMRHGYAMAQHSTPTPAPTPAQEPIVNAMTVDVEDYFQVQALADAYPRAQWDEQSRRVEHNTDQVLSLLADHGAKATFFTLGWVAERHKALIRRIVDNGHELASHGYEHVRADRQSRDAFAADVGKTKRILEDSAGAPVSGYRAATFSIGRENLWAFEVLAAQGYAYSSSIYPIRHDNYGMPEAPRFAFHPVANTDFLEVPISTASLAGLNLPCGGGGYFRLLPYVYSKWSISRLNQREKRPSVLYFHPWEIDPDQPRPGRLGLKTRVRHYTNLGRMEARLARVLGDFRWDRMDRVFMQAPGAPQT
jgi:polysaccharide deacetylase family protein (PEP-CTERM system associated)